MTSHESSPGEEIFVEVADSNELTIPTSITSQESSQNLVLEQNPPKTESIEVTEIHVISADLEGTIKIDSTQIVEVEDLLKDVPITSRETRISDENQIANPAKSKKIEIPPIIETISMVNARVGEAYEQQIPISEGFFISGYGNVDDPGLHIDTVERLIKGTPTKAGTVEIELFLKSDSGKSKKQKINFAVIPDPKSLWKDLPAKVDGPFWKMPFHSDFVLGDLEMFAASRRGRSHAHEGTNRDDDFALMCLGRGNWHIAAVADGAGASKYSRRASQIAVNHALLRLPNLLSDNVEILLSKLSKDLNNLEQTEKKALHDAFYRSLAVSAFEAGKRIREEFVAAELTQRDFYTTLLLVAAKRHGEGWIVGSFSVGDGGIGIYNRQENRMTRLSHADGGAFAGETVFLTTDELAKAETFNRVKFAYVKDFTAIVLMTDGVTDPFFPADNDLDDLGRWHKFWDSVTSDCNLDPNNKLAGSELVNWLDFYMQGQNDDRTLAILKPVAKGSI